MIPLSFLQQLEREVEISFTLAQGNGGPNVNKVATAVQLRFDVVHSALLSDHARATILASGDSRLTKDGILVLRAQEFRKVCRYPAEAVPCSVPAAGDTS